MPRGSRRSLIPFMIRRRGRRVPDRDALLDGERRPLDEGVAARAHRPSRATPSSAATTALASAPPPESTADTIPTPACAAIAAPQAVALRVAAPCRAPRRAGSATRPTSSPRRCRRRRRASSASARHASSRAAPSSTRGLAEPRAPRPLSSAHLPLDLLGDAVEADQEPGRRPAQPEGAQRLGVDQLDRGGMRSELITARAAPPASLSGRSADDQAVGVGRGRSFTVASTIRRACRTSRWRASADRSRPRSSPPCRRRARRRRRPSRR